MLLERLQRSALRLDQERRSLAAARGVDPGSVSSTILVRHRPEAGALIEVLEAVVREIERDGAQLKDVALGLVDSPSELFGTLVHFDPARLPVVRVGARDAPSTLPALDELRARHAPGVELAAFRQAL